MRNYFLKSSRFVSATLLFGMVATSVPAVAQNASVPASAPELATTQGVQKGKKKKRMMLVNVTNLANGAVGCHNDLHQTSFPGKCPGHGHTAGN